MSDSVLLWIALAVLLFWSIGAYNRLMRLRFQASAAFGSLEHVLKQHVSIVQANFPAPAGNHSEFDPDQGHDTPDAAALRLVAAAGQFAVSLSIAKAAPLDELTMSALRTAHEALHLSWSRVRDLPHDLAGPALSPALQSQWEHTTSQAELAEGEFARLVMVYNNAVQQFPALLLAGLFGLKTAKSLATHD